PAPGHTHGGHGHLDHRPGAAAPVARRRRRRLVRPLRATHPARPLAARFVGRPAVVGPRRARPAERGCRHALGRAPARCTRPRRPGRRRAPPGDHDHGPEGARRAPRAGRAMKVAIAGAGSVGTAIAADLFANGHDVLVFEQDPDLVERLRPTLGITWVAADACEVSSLDAAGLSTVDVVVAATGDDEDNLVISLLAKQEFAVPRVVARVNHSKNQWLFNEGWGVDISVSTPQLITAIVEEAVSVGSLVRLLQFEGGASHLVEVTLAPESPAVGSAIAALGIPREAAIV